MPKEHAPLLQVLACDTNLAPSVPIQARVKIIRDRAGASLKQGSQGTGDAKLVLNTKCRSIDVALWLRHLVPDKMSQPKGYSHGTRFGVQDM